MGTVVLTRRWLSVGSAILVAVLLTGCAHPSGSRRPTTSVGFFDEASPAVQSLQRQLTAMAPTVDSNEARGTALCACRSAQELAKAYRVVRPPLLHNCFVNVGLRERGLCFHWAEDLLAATQNLNLTTLKLHWGIAHAGTFREHNSVVVTAIDQPFERGIVLDAWRHSGRLYWVPVATDRYPWKEAEWEATP